MKQFDRVALSASGIGGMKDESGPRTGDQTADPEAMEPLRFPVLGDDVGGTRVGRVIGLNLLIQRI